MCILLKVEYAKFGVSNLFFKKVIEENLWRGVNPPPSVGKGRVKIRPIGLVAAVLIGFSHIFFHTECTISHKSIE